MTARPFRRPEDLKIIRRWRTDMIMARSHSEENNSSLPDWAAMELDRPRYCG